MIILLCICQRGFGNLDAIDPVLAFSMLLYIYNFHIIIGHYLSIFFSQFYSDYWCATVSWIFFFSGGVMSYHIHDIPLAYIVYIRLTPNNLSYQIIF